MRGRRARAAGTALNWVKLFVQNGAVCAVSVMPVYQALPQTWYDPPGPTEPDRAAAPWHTVALHALHVTAPNWGYAEYTTMSERRQSHIPSTALRKRENTTVKTRHIGGIDMREHFGTVQTRIVLFLTGDCAGPSGGHFVYCVGVRGRAAGARPGEQARPEVSPRSRDCPRATCHRRRCSPCAGGAA